METTRNFDGTYSHIIRQSSISEFLMCPEMMRTGGGKGETDATAIGTAVHAGIEAWLGDPALTLEQCREIVFGVLGDLYPKARLVQTDNQAGGQVKAHYAFDAFWQRRHHFPLGGLIEHRFELPNIWRDPIRTITFQGTMDYYTPGMVWDWKTLTKDLQGSFWETKRYAVQPTMYLLAVKLLFNDEANFTYVRAPKDGNVLEMSTVGRDEGDFRALIDIAVNMATLAESNLPTWPKRPTGWHCSAKWCKTLREGNCMGKYLGEKEWNRDYM